MRCDEVRASVDLYRIRYGDAHIRYHQALIKTSACGVHMTVGATPAKGDLVRTTPGHVSTTEATS